MKCPNVSYKELYNNLHDKKLSIVIGIFYRTKIFLNAASLTLMAGCLLSCLSGSFDTNVGFRENKNHKLANQSSGLDTSIHDFIIPKFGCFGFLYGFF